MLGILPTSLVLVTFIVFFLLPVLVVTFSNGFLGGQDSNAEEDVDFEMNLSQSYFSSEFREWTHARVCNRLMHVITVVTGRSLILSRSCYRYRCGLHNVP